MQKFRNRQSSPDLLDYEEKLGRTSAIAQIAGVLYDASMVLQC